MSSLVIPAPRFSARAPRRNFLVGFRAIEYTDALTDFPAALPKQQLIMDEQ